MNFFDEIRNQSVAQDIALVQGGREVAFGEFFEAVEALASEFSEIVSGRGRPRIALSCPDGIDYIILALAVLKSGSCFVPVPEELAPPERAELLRSTAPHAYLAPSEQVLPELVETTRGSIRSPITGSCFGIHSLTGLEARFPEDELEALNPCFIRFSSGTTGGSKGVVISHERLRERVKAANRGLGLGRGDQVLWVLPMAHHFAVSIMLYLYAGATTVVETSPLAEDLHTSIHRSRATLIYGSPYHFRGLADLEKGQPFPQLKRAIVTTAALDSTLAERFEERYRLPLTQALGVIEVGLPIVNLDHASEDPTALGIPLPDYEIMLLDENGESAIQGAPGALQIRGPGLFDAYLDPWTLSTEACPGGFFSSGDLVVAEKNGLLRMMGRSKSVINIAGMKVFPEQVEAVIDAHPMVDRCLVFAEDHPVFGSFPVAEIVVMEKIKPVELSKWCRERLAPYKIPKRFSFVEELPMTASGKLRRQA